MLRTVFTLLALICLFSSSALAQKKTAHKPHASSGPVCKATSVPKGMVIVGYKKNAACGGGMELTVKKPAESETVCAASAVPDGYSVRGIQGTLACQNGDGNQVSNAMVIARGDAPPAAPASGSYGSSSSRPSLRVGAQADQRARQLNAEARQENTLNNASAQRQIMVGMTMQQVRAAWGSPANASQSVSSGSGASTTWTYYSKGQRVYIWFGDDNLVSSYDLSQ